MPEMTFTVQWPDGRVERCWSPSLVMWDHLEVGAGYPAADFLHRASTALDAAAERVRLRYGFACTSALAQREALERTVGDLPDDAEVRVLAMHPPLPVTA